MRAIFILLMMVFTLSTTSSCIVHLGHRPPQGVVVVKTRPAQYQVIRVQGKKYYHWNNNHYQRVRGGYILVRL
ncbi:MAG: hypothetical protein Q8J84_03755 [Flavobacteriaceae bacterium]|nr:hypothetical protein [Flavobacteriaceae bacterium]